MAPFDESLLAEAELAIADLGLVLRSRDAYATTPGDDDYDSCAYFEYLGRVLTDAADALTLTEIDAMAAAYRLLEFPELPVGSGPWRGVVDRPGVSLELAAFDAFHRSVPATERMDVRLIRSVAEAVDAIRSWHDRLARRPLRGR